MPTVSGYSLLYILYHIPPYFSTVGIDKNIPLSARHSGGKSYKIRLEKTPLGVYNIVNTHERQNTMNTSAIASVFETIMILSFGISWPLSIMRSVRSKSTKGKSLLFMLFIDFGYICGIVGKTLSGNFNLAYWFYYLNLIMVTVDICLYFRNRRLEKSGGEK